MCVSSKSVIVQWSSQFGKRGYSFGMNTLEIQHVMSSDPSAFLDQIPYWCSYCKSRLGKVPPGEKNINQWSKYNLEFPTFSLNRTRDKNNHNGLSLSLYCAMFSNDKRQPKSSQFRQQLPMVIGNYFPHLSLADSSCSVLLEDSYCHQIQQIVHQWPNYQRI